MRRARLRSPGELWGRRTILIGLAAIVIAIVGAFGLLLDSDGGDESQSSLQDAIEEKQAELTESLQDPKTGISVRWPSDWQKLEKGGTFGFQSPDKKLVITISAPAPAADADQLRKDVIDTVRQQYGKATVQPGKERTIGGLEATGAAVKGPDTSTLVAVAAGEKYAYLLQILSAPDVPGETLVEGQLITSSIGLSS